MQGATLVRVSEEEVTDRIRRIAEQLGVTGEGPDEPGREWLRDVFATVLPIGGLAVLFGTGAGNPAVLAAGVATLFGGLVALVLAHRERPFSFATFGSEWSRLRSVAPLSAAAAVFLVLTGDVFGRWIDVAATLPEPRQPRETSAMRRVPTVVSVESSSPTSVPLFEQDVILSGPQVDAPSIAAAVPARVGRSQRFVADVERAAEILQRNGSGSDTVDARIITGALKEKRPGSIVIEDERGHSHVLEVAEYEVLDLQLEERVIAVTDPNMRLILDIDTAER